MSADTTGTPDAGPQEFDAAIGETFVTGGPEGIGEIPYEEVPEEESIDTGGEGDPAGEFRRILGRFATGVTIVTTEAGDGEQVHGMTANAFMSVSLRPPLVVVSVDKRARMHGLLHVGKTYGVSVLGRDQRELSDRFGGRPRDHAPDTRFEVIRETPLVEGAIAHLVARVARTYWGGDHSLFLGQVEYARWGEGHPLLFHGGQYEELGLAAAPIFQSLSPELQRTIVARGAEVTFDAGQAVVREGDPGDALFMILEGRAVVTRDERPLRELGEGDFFGEVAVLDGRARSADVVAETPLRCVAIPRDVLQGVLSGHPEVAWEILVAMAGAIRGD
jgi:flavin reductase (DIM6/NTAB) family NADH-FMN oxidoreductase RutF